MPNRTHARNSLFITRHATQNLLHSALSALPSGTYGLLGGRNSVIQTVYPFDHRHHPDPSLTKHIQLLEASGTPILALYISSTIHGECTDALRGRVTQMCSTTDVDARPRLLELPMVVVYMETTGRMDVVLLDKEDNTELPLILQEDRRAIPHAG